MSYPFRIAGLSSRGGWPQAGEIEYVAYVRGGAGVAGDLYQQARLQGDDAGVTFTAGAETQGAVTHIMANVVAPVAASLLHNVPKPYFGVLLRNTADDILGRIRLYGYVSAFVIDTSASIAIGDGLIPTTAKNLDGGTGAANEIILAMAQAIVTTPTTRELAEVLLNGVGGFCNGHHDAAP